MPLSADFENIFRSDGHLLYTQELAVYRFRPGWGLAKEEATRDSKMPSGLTSVLYATPCCSIGSIWMGGKKTEGGGDCRFCCCHTCEVMSRFRTNVGRLR